MRPQSSPSDCDGGFALVLVLWILLLAGAIGTGVVLHGRATREEAGTEMSLVRARLLADGAINRTIATLLDPHDELRPPLDGTASIQSLFGHSITVEVEAEVGKIDLNDAPEPLLKRILLALGLPAVDAEILAREVVTWRAPARADDRTAATYQEEGRPYAPRFGPFRSVEELHLIRGMSAELFERLAPLVTIWSQGGSIDRSVVGDELLSILESSGDISAATQRAARARGEAAGASRPPIIGEVFSIRARVQEGTLTLARVAVVQVAGDRRKPFAVLSWQ